MAFNPIESISGARTLELPLNTEWPLPLRFPIFTESGCDKSREGVREGCLEEAGLELGTEG